VTHVGGGTGATPEALARLEMLLDGEGIDYWEDEGLTEAIALARALGVDEWQRFSTRALRKPREWPMRLAQICGSLETSRALPTLLELLAVGDDEVAEAAADSLRSHEPDSWLVLTPAHVSRLEALAARGGVGGAIIGRWLQSMPRTDPSASS
jgi:hypothetical protein